MATTTSMACSKTAAVIRVLDCVPKGYHRYTSGTVKAVKGEPLARKFHSLYGIGCTLAQRLTRKGRGLANTVLVMHWTQDAELVHWLLLATDESCLEEESLRIVEEKRRLNWLGRELVRHATHGCAAWTCRRPQQEMADLGALLAFQAGKRHHTTLVETLDGLAAGLSRRADAILGAV